MAERRPLVGAAPRFPSRNPDFTSTPAATDVSKFTPPKSTPPSNLTLIPSGATLLDLGLGGGWACGRVSNIVGDTSSGKSLLAIEACANFAKGRGIKDIRYNETENAFDKDYAESIGLPSGVKFVGHDAEKLYERHGSRTVEEFQEDFEKWVRGRIGKGPCMYVLDSFDAMEARSELERKFGDRQPGVKAALASEFYRTHIADVAEADCLFLMISQLRDKIGVMFGETQDRSGGRSHDYYASQIVWLATGRAISEKRGSPQVEREVGVHTRMRVKKNKVGKPHARFPLVIYYSYGIDDELSNIEWLLENKMGAAGGSLTVPIDGYAQALKDVRRARDADTLGVMREELRTAVRTRWAEIEDQFAPSMSKYD
jgi:recombination protein RecA